MKKYLVIIPSVLFIWLAYIINNYYAPPHIMGVFKTIEKDDTIRIAYIGDSWAFYHQNHHCQLSQILEDTIHKPVKVYSYGICGHTSKEIYYSLFKDSDFNDFIKRGYNYCFISAGINDTYKKMSTSYYKKSIEGIIKLLLYNHIRPIILEIPDYNILQAYEWQPIEKKALRHLSMMINHTPMDCKELFRNTLEEITKENNYRNSISVIRYKYWNNNYENDLKDIYIEDGMHLNDKGYETLDRAIALEIIKLHKKK